MGSLVSLSVSFCEWVKLVHQFVLINTTALTNIHHFKIVYDSNGAACVQYRLGNTGAVGAWLTAKNQYSRVGGSPDTSTGVGAHAHPCRHV